MKKFTEINESNELNEDSNIIEEKTEKEKIKDIIDETISIETDDESNINENLEITGKEELVETLLELYNSEKEYNISIIKEQIETKYFHNLDIKDIDESINKLQEQLDNNYKNK